MAIAFPAGSTLSRVGTRMSNRLETRSPIVSSPTARRKPSAAAENQFVTLKRVNTAASTGRLYVGRGGKLDMINQVEFSAATDDSRPCWPLC